MKAAGFLALHVLMAARRKPRNQKRFKKMQAHFLTFQNAATGGVLTHGNPAGKAPKALSEAKVASATFYFEGNRAYDGGI